MPAQPERQDFAVRLTLPDFSSWWMILLLSCAAILLIVSFTLIDSSSSGKEDLERIQNFVKELKESTAPSQFEGDLWRKRYFDNLEKVSESSRKEEILVYLSEDFKIVKNNYIATRDPQSRMLAQRLGNFLVSVYSLDLSDYKVDCIDADCGNTSYSDSEQTLIDLVEQIKFKNGKSKQEILKNLEAANLSEDPRVKWQYRDNSFRIILSEIKEQKNEDPKVRECSQKIIDLIKTEHPDYFQDFEKLGLYKID